jgi:glutathione S-transferase
MKLIIGNKNYSSWSMRPWMLLTGLDIPFEEEKLSFNDPQWKAKVRRHSPVGKVPVLVDGDVTVWDSLAIVEYVAEKFPDRAVWPRDRAARAHARAICAEMHAGFSHMRNHLGMNCELRLPNVAFDRETQHDIKRVIGLWSDCRARFGQGGPFLCGAFSAADAYYAPVVRRFVTYGVALPDVARAYVATMEELPAMRSWMSAALAEHEFVEWDEPYRDSRA